MEADLTWLKGLGAGTVAAIALMWSVRLILPWWMKRTDAKDALDAKREDNRAESDKAERSALLEVVRDCTAAMVAMKASSEAQSRSLEVLHLKVDNLLNGVQARRETSEPAVRSVSAQGV